VESQTSGRTIVLVGVFFAIALMLILPMRSWLTQRGELAELSSELEVTRARVAGLQQQESNWQEPAYIEEQARLRLNMVKSGEIGLILRGNDVAGQDVSQEVPPNTWYERLWQSTDSASGRRPTEIVGGNVQDSPNAN